MLSHYYIHNHAHIPLIIIHVLWDDVSKVECVIHALLAVGVVSCCCHVTSAPPTPPIVAVGGSEVVR